MLIKTSHFNKQFLTNLVDIVFRSRQYKEELNDNFTNLKVGYGHQIFRKVKFVGSYTTKKYGDYITDIDIIQLVEWNDALVSRISDIMKKLDKTKFFFIRFYCGFVEDLALPWLIDGNGSCKFDLDDAMNWLFRSKRHLPENVYNKIYNIMNKDSLSLRDIIDVEKIVEPYLSLNWTKEDLIRGYKIYENKRYNLLDVLKSYPKKKVLKYLYRYTVEDEKTKTVCNEYCLLDVSLRAITTSKQENKGDEIELKAYYENDSFKIVKYMKKYLPDDVRTNQYAEAIKSRIGKYTPLAGRIELIDKCKKYKTISQSEIDILLNDAKEYANTNNISTIDYDEIQTIIYNNISDIYMIFKPLIIPQYERIINVYEIRGEESRKEVPKKVLQQRMKEGVECIFFPVDLVDLNNLITVSLNSKIDPKRLLSCTYDACAKLGLDIHKEIKKIFDTSHKYKIQQDNESYFLVVENNIISKSQKLGPLQIITLFGPKTLIQN